MISLINSNNIKKCIIQIDKKKFFRVYDNSFQICLSDGRNHFLAGTENNPGNQIVEIMTEPYLKEVHYSSSPNSLKDTFSFIIGKDKNGLLHEIVYHWKFVF